MRFVADDADLADAYSRCQSEATAAFGRGDVYVEEFFPRARHIEIQVIGDGSGVTHLWERECSLQRRHQKVVEIAPSPTLPDSTRQRADRGGFEDGAGNRLRERRDVRVPGRRARRRALCIHRGERTLAGRAYGHGRNPRHRSRPGSAADCSWRNARGNRSGAKLDSAPARLRDAAARQHGIHAARRHDAADQRHAERIRTTGGSGRPRRQLRLRRVPHVVELRSAAREGDRAFFVGQLYRRRAACVSRAVRVPHRRCRDERRLPAEPAVSSVGGVERNRHHVHRAACERACCE